MRLHELELSAFGPFAGTELVDLDAVGADGLFLVQGDTGAGKTTLLDAVAYALFGRVPGPRNEAKRLRCDRSPTEVVTQVRLVVTIAGHRLEIIRRPEYERPKSRGDGMTVQRGKVSLRWIGAAPNGRPAEGLTRADEIGDTVIDLLGMSADQFFQVVLLPQGDFAKFLRADTAERGDLLERLFDTGRFGRIEEWFAAGRREVGGQLRAADDVVRQMLARLAESARTDPPEGANEAWLTDVRDLLADRAELSAQHAAAARTCREVTGRALAEAMERAARTDRWRRLGERSAQLEAQRSQVESDRLLVQRHGRTATVLAAANQHEDARQVRVEAWRGRRAADRALQRAVAPPGGADLLDLGLLADDAVAVRAAATADRDLAEELTAAVTEAAEQERDLRQLERAKQRHHRDEVAAVDVEQRLVGLPARITELESRVDGARAARDLLPSVREQLAAAEGFVKAAGSVAERQQLLSAATTAAADAVDRHQAAVDHRQALVEARIAGIAAELAAELTDGDTCPVCGSTEHPQLASSSSVESTLESIRQAQATEHRAALERDQAAQRRWTLEQAVQQSTELACGRTVVVARAELAELTEQHSRLAAVARNLDALLGLREAAGKALFELGLRREDLTTTLAAGAAEITDLTGRTGKRISRLHTARAGHESVQARRSFLLDRALALDAIAACAGELAAADEQVERTRRALAAVVTEAGFADLDEAVAVAAVDVEKLGRQIRAADDDRAAVAAQLLDPQFDGLSGDPVDVSGHRMAASAAAADAERAITQAHGAAERRGQVAVAARRLRAAWRDREPISEREAEIAALADVMQGRGQNALGISLRTYVLAARLKEVAAAAGQRLDRMSAGRYTFVHSTDREARGKAGGLGLDILDGWSGLVRPTKTLSGGESFLASLALALGLADVVAAEAGGRVLDTLFVDEGFGSLDPDTLDLVMGTLDELRAGGRVVGVVSHVDELRQRIPSQIRVSRNQQGSTLAVATG